MDVKGVPKSTIELGSLHLVEMTGRRGIQNALRHREEVVAADHAGLRQPLLRANLDLRADPPNRPRDGRASHCAQDGDGGVAGQDADGTPTGRRTQVSPEDVAASYHAGAVSAASRRAASTRSGSWG